MNVYPTGVDLIQTGRCPLGGLTSLACMFCPYGHMTECHYPCTCEEAECSHYQRDMEADFRLDMPDDKEELP